MSTPGYLPFHDDPKKPALKLPANACDAHCHVFGPGNLFPYSSSSSYIPVDAPRDVLFQRHRFLGLERAVIVQASCHGFDNSAMLDALRAGHNRYRGVALLTPEVDDRHLAEMHEAGVRGVRFNFVKRLKARQSEEVRQAIIKKIMRFSWHVVVYFVPVDLPVIRDFLVTIPTRVVIDHMGCVPVDKGVESAEFEALAALVVEQGFWIKVASVERLSKTGPPYDDTNRIARELISLAPDRVLWGTDWPHPNMTDHIPDDGMLVDRIASICPEQKLIQKILVSNPAELYWDVS